MKKILFILMLCVSMVACKKHEIEDVETTPMVTITFDQQIVSSNSMVRSTTNEFLDIIEEQTSDYVNVTLKNLDLDKTYTCKSNETITIPVGNYEISGNYNSSAVSCPKLKCDTFNFNIKYDTKAIILNVYYNCYAIFALIDECKSCSYEYEYGKFSSLSKKNKYYIAYFSEDEKIKLTPYDDSTEFITTEYQFSTTYTIGKVYAEYGKYYVIHPQKVDKTASTFEVNLENMIEGEI